MSREGIRSHNGVHDPATLARGAMSPDEFLEVTSRITSTVYVTGASGDISPALLIAISAANAFNAGAAESRRLLTLARGQLMSGSLSERVAAELRTRAQHRELARAELIAQHHPLLS